MRRLFIWLALCATAGATPFQANLQTLLGQPASRAWAVLNLQGCGTYIVKGSGSTIIPRPIFLYPNAQGLIGTPPAPLVNITDETTFVCGGAVGTAYYRIDIYYTDTEGKTQHPAGDNYDIAGLAPFNLNTAVPKNNFVGGIGPQGPPGPTGPAGPSGPTGPAGANGANGTNGATGATGPQGPQGPAGIAGGQVLWRGTYNAGNTYSRLDAVTFQGSSYLSIQDSNIGHSPDTNPSFWGLMAQAGVNGSTGATGPQGPAGSQGPQGPAGGTVAWRGTWSSATAYVLNDAVTFNGSSYVALQSGTNKPPDANPSYWQLAAQKGDTGLTGSTGATGATGPTGSTGANGAAATATAGTTTTGAPGTNAAVANSGSTSAAIFDFTIPRGAVGATGPQGPQGPPGTATAAGAPADIQIAGATGSLDADTGKLTYTKAAGAIPGILSSGVHAMTGHPELSLSYTLSGAQLAIMQVVVSGANGAQTVVATFAAPINPLRWNVNDTFQLNNLPSANALNTLNGADFKASAVTQTRPTGTVTFPATTSIVPGTYILNQGYGQIYGDTIQGHVLLFNRCQSTTNNPAQTGTCGLAYRDAFKWRAGPPDYMGHDVAGMRGGTRIDPINAPGTGALRVNGAHSLGATTLSVKKDAGSNWVAVNGDKIAVLHGNSDKDFDVYTITNSPNVTVTQGANTSVTISPALLTSLLDGEFISPYLLKIQVGDASGLEVPGPADFLEVPNFVKGIPEAQITSLVADLAARPLDTTVVHNSGNESVTGVKTFSSPLVASITLNAGTATALDHNPADCPTGQVAAGIDATGAASGCAPSVASAAGALKDIQYAGAGSPPVLAADTGSLQWDSSTKCLKLAGTNICGLAGQQNRHVYAISGAAALTLPGSGNSAFGFDATTGLFEISELNVAYWQPAHDTAVVHNSGVETVAGVKTFSSKITGNIDTAVALAANGANCATTGQAAAGVDASGVAEGCLNVPSFLTNAKTATYQVLASDFQFCKTIPVASGTFTITLVASGGSQPADGQCIDIINYGSGVVTVARSGQNINGAAANLTLAAGSASVPTGVHVVSNATDYVAQMMGAGGGGAVSSVFGRTGAVVAASADYTAAQVTNAVDKSAANTGATGMTLDMSAVTGAVAFKVPVIAGATAGADGVVDYDSTNKNTHLRTNAADSIAVTEAAAIAANTIPKATDATHGLVQASSLVDDGTTVTSTDTGGMKAPAFTATGTTAGFYDYPQGTTSSAVAPCNTATSICEQAPTAVTSYLVTKPGAAASGIRQEVNSSNVITQSFTGDAAHSLTQASKTAAVTTFTLCAAIAGTACGQVGQYRIHWNFWGSGTACSAVTVGSVGLNLTWTDENAVAHTTISMPMWDQKTAAAGILFNFNTALGTEGASGDYTISTNGTIIQAATTYTACTTGTGTYNLRMSVMQLQ